MFSLRVSFLMSVMLALVVLSAARPAARPDSGETVPLPGPGLSYGGIPYGSMSGNVAEYFRTQAPPSGRAAYLAGPRSNHVDYAPIEQYLR